MPGVYQKSTCFTSTTRVPIKVSMDSSLFHLLLHSCFHQGIAPYVEFLF